MSGLLVLPRLAQIRVVVIGDAPEVERALGDSDGIVRAPIDGDVAEGTLASAVIVDLRGTDATALLRLQRLRSRVASAPALVLAAGSLDDELLAALDAMDAVAFPSPPRIVERRIRAFVELAQGRLEAHLLIDTLSRRVSEEQSFGRAILDGVEVGIITTDEYGVVTFVNRVASKLLELGHDARGLDVGPLLGLGEGPQALLGRESRRAISYALETSDGVTLEMDLSVSRGERAHDGRAGFFFIFRDAREEKQREEKRQRFERLAAMGTMVAGFAHEVRNPVAALRSIAEELGEEHAERDIELPHVSRMLQVLERIERLVKTSLQFGRPAAPRRARHGAWSILSTVIERIGPRLRAAGEKLKVEIDPNLPDVLCDSGQIAQAMVILLDNALDATGSAAGVLLHAGCGRPSSEHGRRKSQPPSDPRAWVRFQVTDLGAGVPPEILGRIFDPFFTTKAQGTGLGLSIAQQFVGENGGRLEVSSPRGGPTTFTILLPSHR